MTEPTVWDRLAAPIAADRVSWRQDGKVGSRDGKYFARFVAYVDAQTVRERLDRVCPGEWTLDITPLPPIAADPNGEVNETPYAFKATLTVNGLARACVGMGRDYKAASTDAFKRAAVRFGIAHELYEMDPLWVPMDGDGKFAKPLEDPAAVYARKHGSNGSAPAPAPAVAKPRAAAPTPPTEAPAHPVLGAAPKLESPPTCPECGGRMWDNRDTKRNPKAPDFKCRDRGCSGVIWPPKQPAGVAADDERRPWDDQSDDDNLPF